MYVDRRCGKGVVKAISESEIYISGICNVFFFFKVFHWKQRTQRRMKTADLYMVCSNLILGLVTQGTPSSLELSRNCPSVPNDQTLIKALTGLVGRLSLSVGWEHVLNGDLRLFHLTFHFCNLSKQCRS